MTPFEKRTTFLDEVAARLVSGSTDLSRLCVLTPSRRSVVFLRKALASRVQQPVWAPRISAIQDYLRAAVNRQVPEEMTLVTELYKVYLRERKAIDPAYAESFTDFFSWGQLLLKDFDEVDRYLAPPDKLFANLQDLREIDVFFEGGDEERAALRLFSEALGGGKTPGVLANRFLGLWAALQPVYDGFSQRLAELGWAYDGWAYREVAERMPVEQAFPFEQVVFVGFNALTRAEEAIIDRLADKGRVRLFWDSDSFFEGEGMEMPPAGDGAKFIRRYHKRWADRGSELIRHDRAAHPVDIQLMGIPYQMSQAVEVGRLVAENLAQGLPPESQAVVLGAEDMLLPVLDQLPDSVPALNITMGYPLSLTPAYQFLLTALSIQTGLVADESGQAYMPYRLVIQAVSQAYVRISDPESATHWHGRILNENLVKVPLAELQNDSASPLWKALFTYAPDQELMSHFEQVFALLSEWLQEGADALEGESLIELFTRFNLLKKAFVQLDEMPDRRGFVRLVTEILRTARAPFEGEPLEGLQMMGFLETRLLDFDTVYILGANEGILPKSSEQHSFIPYHLRKAFGLPTFEDQDAVFAYHFFRLLQRPRRIYLLYNTLVQDLGGAKEMSRYLRQILHFPALPALRISHVQYTQDIPAFSPPVIGIEPDTETLAALKKRFSPPKFFSATALISWLQCRLQFYFRYVLGVREPDTVSDALETRVIGNVLHLTFEALYKPRIGQPFTPPEQSEIEQAIDQAFETEWQHPTDWSKAGINGIYRNILVDVVKETTRIDAAEAPFEVYQVENHIAVTLPHPAWGQVSLGGKIDRIDRVGDGLRVVDYKSGVMNPGDLKADLDKIFRVDQPAAKPFQGLFYAWLHQKATGTIPRQVTFFSTRKPSQGHVGMPAESLLPGALQAFEDRIMNLLTEMHAGPYDQTSKEENCGICEFRQVCQRGRAN